MLGDADEVVGAGDRAVIRVEGVGEGASDRDGAVAGCIRGAAKAQRLGIGKARCEYALRSLAVLESASKSAFMPA